MNALYVQFTKLILISKILEILLSCHFIKRLSMNEKFYRIDAQTLHSIHSMLLLTLAFF